MQGDIQKETGFGKMYLIFTQEVVYISSKLYDTSKELDCKYNNLTHNI